MRKFLIASAALVALSASAFHAPAFAMEGNYEPTATASGFGRAAPGKPVGNSFQFNMGEGAIQMDRPADTSWRLPAGRIAPSAFSYTAGGNG